MKRRLHTVFFALHCSLLREKLKARAIAHFYRLQSVEFFITMTPSVPAINVAEEDQGEGIVTPYTRNEDGNGTSRRPKLLHRISSISLPNEQSGLFGTSSNMVNAIVGAGIVGMPYALNNAGFLMGVFLLCLVGYLTDKSLRLIVDLASFHPRLAHLGVLTYEDLMKVPFGQRGFHFIMLSVSILAYGCMVAYLLVIKDTLPAVMGITEDAGSGNFFEAELVMLVSSSVLILPLCMMRDMVSRQRCGEKKLHSSDDCYRFCNGS